MMLLGAKKEKGLSNYLADQRVAVADIVAEAVGHPIRVIPSGPRPPNPAELLSSPRFAALLEELAAESDFVFVDTPPVLVAADTPIIAAQTQSALVVVHSGRTRVKDVRELLRVFAFGNVKIAGAVLNNQRSSAFGSYYGYGSYRYRNSAYETPAGHNGVSPSPTSGLLRWIGRSVRVGRKR
jgi:Mrp family chromosome partitioning ATPase